MCMCAAVHWGRIVDCASVFSLMRFVIRVVKALLPLGERPLGTAPTGPHVMLMLCAKSKILDSPHLLLPFSLPAPLRSSKLHAHYFWEFLFCAGSCLLSAVCVCNYFKVFGLVLFFFGKSLRKEEEVNCKTFYTDNWQAKHLSTHNASTSWRIYEFGL